MTFAEHAEHEDQYVRIVGLNVPESDVAGDPENVALAAAQREFSDQIVGTTGWALAPRDDDAVMRLIFGGVVEFEPDQPFAVEIPEGLEALGEDGEPSGRLLVMRQEIEPLDAPTEETH